MLHLILALALLGLIVWLITNYIPMPDVFKKVIIVVVVVFVILWLMSVLGISDVPVPHLR